MRAIIIAVGSELLDLGRIDTNSLYISDKLADYGILTSMKMIVGDDLTNLSWTIKNAYKRAQLVVITGGLGPTEDDITREAAAEALKLKLLFKEEIVKEIEIMFKKRGITMPEINTRQAFVIEGAEVLENGFGTAPGQYYEQENCRLLLLPGPPQEMKPIFDNILKERISKLSNFFIYRRNFKFGGITESETDSIVSGIYRKYKNPVTTILASPGLIEIHLLGRSKRSVDEAKELTDGQQQSFCYLAWVCRRGRQSENGGTAVLRVCRFGAAILHDSIHRCRQRRQERDATDQGGDQQDTSSGRRVRLERVVDRLSDRQSQIAGR